MYTQQCTSLSPLVFGVATILQMTPGIGAVPVHDGPENAVGPDADGDYDYDDGFAPYDYYYPESCAWNEYRAEYDQCKKCPTCPNGYRYSEPCGDGVGHASVECVGCEAGTYLDGDSDRMHMCEVCTNCAALHRDEIRGCPAHSDQDSFCSPYCWTGFEDSEPDRTDKDRPSMCIESRKPISDVPTAYITSDVPTSAAATDPQILPVNIKNASAVLESRTSTHMIMAGSGGGVLLILLIVFIIIVRVVLRRRNGSYTTTLGGDDDEDEKDRGIELQILNQGRRQEVPITSGNSQQQQTEPSEPQPSTPFLPQNGGLSSGILPDSHSDLSAVHCRRANRPFPTLSFSLESGIYNPLGPPRDEDSGSEASSSPQLQLDSVQPASTHLKSVSLPTMNLHPD